MSKWTTFFRFACFLFLGLASTACRRSLDPSFRVVSGSMAPCFLGPHVRFACGDCGFLYRCSIETLPANEVACPNCGYIQSRTDRITTIGGDLLRLQSGTDNLKRWDPVLIRHPDHDQRYSVKRIVGLPGERIIIRHGDVYDRDTILAKNMRRFDGMAVPVHVDKYSSKKGCLTSRWRAERKPTDWSVMSEGMEYCRTPGLAEPNLAQVVHDEASLDWIVYLHRDCSPLSVRRRQDFSMDDYLSYNQGTSFRRHRVLDLVLSFRLHVSGAGWMAVRISNGHERLILKVKPISGELSLTTLRIADGKSKSNETRIEPITTDAKLQIGIIDGHGLVCIGSHQALQCPLSEREGPIGSESRPFRIFAHNLVLHIQDVHVFRDVHYLDDHGADQYWAMDRPLGKDEFFVLGDNSSVSIDSRSWYDDSPIHRNSILGKIAIDDAGDVKR